MSVVVKMKMPVSCYECHDPICVWLENDICDTIAAIQAFRKINKTGFPDFCPIVCALPEQHGRLGDLDELAAGCDAPYWCIWLSEIEDAQTIVPAELT